ncbi:MAG TPA: 3-carboxy-cis,cis-muconate cycloisomerase [Burkholderiaceae bacterium]|nr:3-carboxy-cis,cis-muconate cycloisomerase [Burkholderiaceae bacterium]
MSHPSALPFDRFLSTQEAVDGFGATALIQHMLDVEAALAKAQAGEGIVPASAAASIAAACRAEHFDAQRIVADGAVAGTVLIPLVKALTAEVARRDAKAAAWVHWGSTSQDVIDTAMVLATRDSLARIDAGLERTIAALTALARTHRDTPMLARTLLQPAQVISVGFKLLAWIAPLVRARRRLQDAARAALQLQLGGAVGTLSTLGDRGGAVVRRVAAELGLRVPDGAWHTQRDEWVALGCEVGLLCGSLGKIALDVGLLAQAEVGEMAEPSGGGRGGSSAMPHKRNPVGSMIVRAVALRTPQRVATLLAAMPQEHERALGSWQAELADWPQLMLGAEGALQALGEIAAGLSIDALRMRANIDALNGLVFAEAASTLFAAALGKSAAHALLDTLAQRCVAERRPLLALAQEARSADPALTSAIDAQALDQAFDAELAGRRAGALADERLTPRS